MKDRLRKREEGKWIITGTTTTKTKTKTEKEKKKTKTKKITLKEMMRVIETQKNLHELDLCISFSVKTEEIEPMEFPTSLHKLIIESY